MATIKAIEAPSVHQIQSGQVIVDLCSVAKELVENGLDAGATSIEIRFKNSGLDLIEVQDNGSGISPENYEGLALKHYTSKLSSFDDLSRLQTFGFRGEALSSLCALSDLHVVTAQAHQAPKASRLDFEPSGKLKKTQVVAGQKGTIISVEGLFKRLPVRRRDLEKNIKREYGKVLSLLHAYACIGTGVRFSVKNTVGKTKNVVVFATSGNPTTKQNIANVYGAKTLSALIPLDLSLAFEPSAPGRKFLDGSRDQDEEEAKNKIHVQGHISRPVFGEGRQTPDRQMLFVNSRPCGLPQIAKAFNEVYKSFNVSQSPFIFADFHMDTNAYDVNVSPDKRTILLHDAGPMIESLKSELTDMFEAADQTVPQSQPRLSLRQQTLGRSQGCVTPRKPSDRDPDAAEEEEKKEEDEEDEEEPGSNAEEAEPSQPSAQGRMKSFLNDLGSSRRMDASSSPAPSSLPVQPPASSSPLPSARSKVDRTSMERRDNHGESPSGQQEAREQPTTQDIEMAAEEELSQNTATDEQPPSSSQPDPSIETINTVQNAFDRMRPRRMPAEVATITIGDKTVTSMVGSGVPKKRPMDAMGPRNYYLDRKRRIHTPSRSNIFTQFAASGSGAIEGPNDDSGEEEEDVEDGEEENNEEEDDEGDDDKDFEDTQEEQPDPQSTSNPPSDGESNHDPDHMEESEDKQYVPDHDAEIEIEVQDTHTSTAPESSNIKDMTEEEKKAHEEAEVQRLIQEAENKAALPDESTNNRANKMNKGAAHRDSTVHLVGSVNGSFDRIQSQMDKLRGSLRSHAAGTSHPADADESGLSQQTAEDRLSLTVTKDDFAKMRIIGQFNLGFILATRSSSSHANNSNNNNKDELFIIDQHASDEKVNFERLQSTTTVQNQRLVHPQTLDLTAVEEEIVLENRHILEKNGFIVSIDDSGNEPIGRRCKLVSLPLSKEVVFGVRDLEELIVLLGETPSSATTATATAKGGDGNGDKFIPRPSKVRRMFAMRACRSSIMVGRTLTNRQMERVVRDMGAIDKPWNCPHGRPTMRHLMRLGEWDEWDEFAGDGGHGLGGDGDDEGDRLDVWRGYLQDLADDEGDGEEEEEEEGEE